MSDNFCESCKNKVINFFKETDNNKQVIFIIFGDTKKDINRLIKSLDGLNYITEFNKGKIRIDDNIIFLIKRNKNFEKYYYYQDPDLKKIKNIIMKKTEN